MARRVIALFAATSLAAALLVLAATTPASAGSVPIVVNTTEDTVEAGGVLSLREAVIASADQAGSSTITFDLPNPVNLLSLTRCAGPAETTGDLASSDGSLLLVAGDGITVEQTCPGQRIFTMAGPLVIDGLDLTGGSRTGSTSIGAGGAIQSSSTVDVVSGSILFLNHAETTGGAISAIGAVTVEDSYLWGNTAGEFGGAVHSENGDVELTRSAFESNHAGQLGGAVWTERDVIATNTTISHNVSDQTGGGLGGNDGTTLVHATVVANTAPNGANVYNLDAATSSIVALGDGGQDCLITPAPGASTGANVGDDGSCDFDHPTDQSGAYPHLRPLFPNQVVGSAGVGHRPILPSSAIDLTPGSSCLVPNDQRLVLRPLGAGCDSGSLEQVPAACTPTFSDVSPSHPFFDEICWMAQVQITEGFQNGTFAPSGPVTRQAMSAFIFRLAMSPQRDLPATAPFPDVPLTQDFVVEIAWMADADITGGFNDGTFRPGASVSRQAMAAFMYRVAGEPEFSPSLIPGENTFPDVTASHPFYKEVEWLASEGISEGYSDGTWRPSIAISRQAMAAFLLRLAEGPELAGL